MQFFRILLGAQSTCHEGYGQTETTGGTSITASEDLSTGHVGGPFAAVEIKLVDVPEMGYLHTDRMHGDLPCCGRGEICVRGPNVFIGYYKNPEATAEVLDAEKWLHSGDIGMWNPDGQLSIIDRKKNLLKLSQGEYIAVEKIENVLAQANLVAQVFVHGDSSEDSLIAIVTLDDETVTDFLLNQLNIQIPNNLVLADLLDEKILETLKEKVMEQFSELSRIHSFLGFEMVKNLYIEPSSLSWSVESGLLTPTMKFKRQAFKERYSQVILLLYKELKHGISHLSKL